MFQTVHVVSIEDVTTRLGAFSFHEKLVNGALEFWFCTFDCCGIQGLITYERWEMGGYENCQLS